MTWNITLRMRRWRDASDFASQKFRLTPGKKTITATKEMYLSPPQNWYKASTRNLREASET